MTLKNGNQVIGKLSIADIAGVTRTDKIEQIDSSTFKITSRYEATENIESVRLCLDFVHASPSDYWMIPSVSYNGNNWGKGKEPKGAQENGQWRIYSYRRTPIPGATYSEGQQFAIAMWSDTPQNEAADFSCSIMPEPETTTHRLIWPEEEMPVVYTARDRYRSGYQKTQGMKKGESVTLTAYITVSPIDPNHTAMHTFLKKGWELSAKPTIPVYSPAKLWQLGVRYAKEYLWAEEGSFKGFSIGLTPAENSGWEQRKGGKYEIGWCGQNASFANTLLFDYLKNRDTESLNKGITTLDTWAANCQLPNGLFVVHYDYILNKVTDGVIDACNLGTAALNYFEAYDLAKQCGLDKPDYEQLAYNICKFAVNDQQPGGSYAKGWKMNGECLYRDGTIGCFLVPPMLEAYRRSGDKQYLSSGIKAFEYYLDELNTKGYTTAGALDTWCIDKESSISLLRSAIRLFKLTNEQKYLNDAVAISYYLSTWLWHYNGSYPSDDNFTQYGYQTFGATSVSVQHHHLDPYALLWVPDWIELSDLTGDTQWKEKATAIWNNGSQLVSDGTLTVNGRNRPAGSQNEAYLECNWNWDASTQFERLNSWLVAWPGAFRLETLRKLNATDAKEFRNLSVKQSWNSQNTGNVLVPGYFADPSILYDAERDSFYLYATSDGMWISYSRDPHVAVSKDLVNWEYKPIVLPDYYPICTPERPNTLEAGVWAPTVFKHPTTGKYYLAYQINLEFYVMMSDTPVGPWINATPGNTAETAPLLKNKAQWGHGDAFDCQFFVDTDATVYLTFGGHGNLGISKIKFDDQGCMSIDQTDPRFTDGDIARYKRITGLPEYNEGSVLVKKDDTYYLSYSVNGSQNYKVRYATAPSPLGPFTPQPGYITERDDANSILGPGHHDMFQFNDNWYILYHRQHFPMVDAKRQVCIDPITIQDGKISLGVQTHNGLSRGSGALEARYQAAKANERADFALGKQAIASSVSDYKGGEIGKEITEPISTFYEAGYAFDANYGTRWQSAVASNEASWILVDLEEECQITDTEIFFEYVLRPYSYTVEYLTQSEATSLQAASQSANWKWYGEGKSKSPAVNCKPIKARFFRLTVNEVNLPIGKEYRGCDLHDYENRASVVEFKIYGTCSASLKQ